MTTRPDLAAIFGRLRFDQSGGECWRREIAWRKEKSIAEIRDAATGKAPGQHTLKFTTTLSNPMAPAFDPEDPNSRGATMMLSDATLADTVALAVADANALLVIDGDHPHGLWLFETEDIEHDGEMMTVHNAFADEFSGQWNASLAPNRDVWILYDPVRSYDADYVRWRDQVLKVLQSDRAPPLLPDAPPS